MPLQTGIILNNRYRIVNLLGQGGFGAVYRAWDLNMECPRALKENLDTSLQAQKQFKLEAKILGMLTHPNLPKVIDHFILPGQGQYLVMEYIEGEDLQKMLEKQAGPLPESQVLPWINQICQALEYLHNQNPPIIHRDIKPANIKVTPDGRAFLVDFGIAKVYDANLKTTVGAKAITPGYSPLEQYGSGQTDARSDVYSLGALLYALLTGKELPESNTRAIKDTVIPADQVNPKVSPQVSAAIHQAIQVDPNLRPQTIGEFGKALRVPATITTRLPLPDQTLPVQMDTHTTRVQPAGLGRGTRWLLGVAGLVIVVLIAALITVSMGQESKTTPEAAALNAAENSARSATVDIMEGEVSAGDTQPETRTNTPTPSLVPTETPSATQTPTSLPSQTPSPTPIRPVQPDQFVRDYYAAVMRREYERTFSLLTVEFRSKHFEMKGDGNFDITPYVNWFNTIDRIEIIRTAIESQSANQARVYLLGKFYFKDGRVVEDQEIFHLVSDGQGSWLINDQGG